MDRVLLGKNFNIDATDNVGFWVSKPNINVTAVAGNTFFQQSDIYGLNQQFEWTGVGTDTHGFRDKSNPGFDRIQTTPNGTIRFTSNTTDPFFWRSLNATSWWIPGSSTGTDESFTGKDYPLLEIKVRRPYIEDFGVWWGDSRNTSIKQIYHHGDDFSIFWRSSNSTVISHEDLDESDLGHPYGYPWDSSHVMNIGSWLYSGWNSILENRDSSPTSVQTDHPPWTIIEFDIENKIVTANCLGTIKTFAMGGAGHANWMSDTKIDGLRFDFNAIDGGPGSWGNKSDYPDIEVDYIRVKKRGIPMNFGDSANDSLQFDSGWQRTGLIHQTGVVQIGTEYAWANGTAKDSGTSHEGSTSGRIEFNELPYIPVVLFQRYDDSDTTNKKSFPGGEKEFSFATCDLSQPTRTWNPTLNIWEETANSNFAAEFRTFAYVRASKDHFDLTCRNAIARDGYEWLFNYAPQEPYIELYKGGNYDPATEEQRSIVVKRNAAGEGWQSGWDDNDPNKDNAYNNPSWIDIAYRNEPWIRKHNVTIFEEYTDGIIDNLSPGWGGGGKYAPNNNDIGALWYYGAFRGTDHGKCLPTFDWANKFGDWNIPQFNSFYKYVPSGSGGWAHGKGGEGTYKSFKGAIGESWTEENTKFLDDSMWMGWANNRNEMKGDIWHPQAPTKTFSERGGLLGFGGWTYDGSNAGDTNDEDGPSDKQIYGNRSASGKVGSHGGLVGFRIGDDQRGSGDKPGSWQSGSYNKPRALVHDIFEYIPDAAAGRSDDNRWLQPYVKNLRSNRFRTGQVVQDRNYDGSSHNPFSAYAKKGPGTYSLYDLPNWYLVNRPPYGNFSPYNFYATFPSWGNPDTTASQGYTITRSYTYPGATYAYDISNFSGPAHYDAWFKNQDMNDYVERDVKKYKSTQDFTRDDGTTPGEGDDRENNDPPLNGDEIDLQRADKTMINHFRQSYEYNLPGKSPHRDGTLRPMGYGPYPLSDYGDDKIGKRWIQSSDGEWASSDYTEQYPVSATYVRSRDHSTKNWTERAGSGFSRNYHMQRHGADQVITSPKVSGKIVVGGISSNPDNNKHTPPGIGQNTINLYPMTAAGDFNLRYEGIDYGVATSSSDFRAVCIVPTKTILSGETVMYSRHASLMMRHGPVGQGKLDALKFSKSHPYLKFTFPDWYYLQGNIFPGMCKADNSLTIWGTEDLSEWGKDASHRAHPTNGKFPLKEIRRGARDGTYMYHDSRDESGPYPWTDSDLSDKGNHGGSNYKDFSGYTKDIPEFQPVTGDGRFFGGVGGVNNRGPGFGDLLGPSLSPEPSIWDLKWSSIYHPFGMTPDPLSSQEASNTFYGATTIQNQTSYIGGAPNKRTLIEGTSYHSDYVDGSGYDSDSVTPEEYDWCIGDPRINSNEWDRKLKRKNLTANTGKTAYHFNYMYDKEKIKPPMYKYWVLRIPASIPAYDGSGL